MTKLEPCARFDYVMSVLEGYSGHDCSTLLQCIEAEIVDARSQALQQLAQISSCSPEKLELGPVVSLFEEGHNSEA